MCATYNFYKMQKITIQVMTLSIFFNIPTYPPSPILIPDYHPRIIMQKKRTFLLASSSKQCSLYSTQVIKPWIPIYKKISSYGQNIIQNSKSFTLNHMVNSCFKVERRWDLQDIQQSAITCFQQLAASLVALYDVILTIHGLKGFSAVFALNCFKIKNEQLFPLLPCPPLVPQEWWSVQCSCDYEAITGGYCSHVLHVAV